MLGSTPKMRWICWCCCCAGLALARFAHAQPGSGNTIFRPMPDDAFLGTWRIARSTAIGDVDNDGWADVAMVSPSESASQVAVWRNDAGRRFYADPKLSMPVYTGGGTILGDYDNDADPDRRARDVGRGIRIAQPAAAQRRGGVY